MWKHSILLMMSMALVLGGTAYGRYKPLDDDALIGWWACDEGSGSTVADSSPNGNDGTAFDGDLIWGPGIHGTAIQLVGTLVEIPAIDLTLTECTMAGWIKPNGTQPAWASIMMTRGSATGLNMNPDTSDLQLAYHWGDGAGTWGYRPGLYLADNEWNFAAVTVSASEAIIYLNAEETAVNAVAHGAVDWSANVYLGGDGSGSFDARRVSDAWLDDVSLFSRALTADEIADIMLGLGDPALASNPSPMNEGTDIPRDDDLSWKAGEGATAHDVYFGTSLADVEAGDAGVLVSQSQSATTFDPGRLEFGQTYYWRVDEHNAEGIATGDVWSFEVEPFAYAVENVTVTTNTTSEGDSQPEKIIDGSGLNDAGQHSVTAADMWLGTPGAEAPVLEFEFDQVYKLDEMVVWNYNVLFELMLGFGLKDVTVEYSADGTEWTMLGDVEFAQATAKTTYEANTSVDFGGVAVKAVRLTVNSAYGPLGQYGLSEVRFMYIPATAREPQPDDGKTNVAPDATLGWRAGREAATHEILVSASAEAVLDGSAVVDTVADATYPMAGLGLEFGTTYYWKVNEVNEAEAIGTWAGPLWRFAIEDYAVIDNFESYTDDDGSRVYEAWLDGWINNTGSTVGYIEAPFAEQTVVNSGRQSMPLQYDNSVAPLYSEAERDFSNVNWNTNGADRLVVNYRGYPVSLVEGADGALTIGAGGADIWDTADEFRFVYKQLSGNGSIIARVDSIANSDPWAKAGVMIRESLTANSTHAMVVVTPENSVSFQRRPVAGNASANTDVPDLTAPHWVKITRTDDIFTAQESVDGVTWVDIAVTTPVDIPMVGNVYIGLAVTSHNANQPTSADFSNISTTGDVTGQWQSAAIGVDQPSNDADQLYVAVEDSAGNIGVVVNPDPAATLATSWQEWEIPFADFAGVNLGSVKRLIIGIGDRDNPSAGGTGIVFIDDIGYGRPAPAAADVTAAGDIVQGVPNDGDWPGAETPDLAIDDDVNTKYLHFKGETEPTGFQVTPAVGPTVVTGLTLTTANDAVERDPITFELYGSKDSIDGPYTLIAAGDVVDFAGATAWERFTMNSTEIAFDNIMSYSHYQLLFPTVRDAGSANSMQIAEIELIGIPAP